MIVNLTPHTINEVTTGASIPPSGRVVRVKATTTKVGSHCGYPIFKSTFSEVEGLPEEEEGTMFIVSTLVMNACPARADLLSPGNLVRNEHGQPVGCVGFRNI